MAQTVVTPSEQARRVAAALHRVPSVQDIRWTADQVVEHLWVCIVSWSDDDYEPVVGAIEDADPHHSVDTWVDTTDRGVPTDAIRS